MLRKCLNSTHRFCGLFEHVRTVASQLAPPKISAQEYEGYITEEDVVVANGALSLFNQKRQYTGSSPPGPHGPYSYTSGWVMSMHKVHSNKGYFEFQARFPVGAKVWPAIWLISEKLLWGPEWDIFEYLGSPVVPFSPFLGS